MHASLRHAAATLALLSLASAQSLSEDLASAIAGNPNLSLFRSLIGAAPQGFDKTLSAKSTDITVLIPSDEAIQSYLSTSGVSDITELDAEDVQTFFKYHVLAASLKSSDFDSPKGKAIPTLLEGTQYNNRSAGAQITREYGKDAIGQVVFAARNDAKGNRGKRQSGGQNVSLRAGLAQDVEMTAIDGSWGPKQANSFQIVNSVLIPPRACSTTIQTVGDKRLTALGAALNKTDLWNALDHSPNVTCLAPSTDAFKDAGDPQISLSKTDLTGALLAHTLKEVTYTNYLEDGMVLGTLNNTTVRVHIKNNDIYFNNAKVIKGNVLTNNGLIHILDSVIMAEASDEPSSTSSSNAPSDTSTESPTSSSSEPSSPQTTDAANMVSAGYPAVVALVAGLFMV
ncbi:hypothetical protein FZEAL_2678 [Fusarium zealandicum]|uniref:FAS1 domain-containing protein n=1 Tax=Fusarium zealandicum TaxID=1053134 RepID=A0A8H4UR13_9HYPO|nr:hypothetical protein FZEAL_2678 [Fusarium zealandicum]